MQLTWMEEEVIEIMAENIQTETFILKMFSDRKHKHNIW